MIAQFIGSEAKSTYDEAKVVILPIPFEKTTYRRGCQNALEAIVTTLDRLEAYDIELGQEVCQNVGIFTTKAIADTRFNPSLAPKMAIASITTDKVFITIDLDGLDPSLMPGVGTPEPGGLNWYLLTKFLRAIFSKHQVIGCDVMELAPTSDSVVSEFTAAKLVYKLIGYSYFKSMF